MAQKSYFAEHGKYSDVLSGDNGIGWKPEGYQGGGKNEKFCYSYGFGYGTEGVNYFTGNLETPASILNMSTIGKDTFLIAAAADIDGDGKYDILTVDQNNNIIVYQDDLAD